MADPHLPDTGSDQQSYPYPWVRLRSVMFHPFIFRRMIEQVAPEAVPGDIVAVYDRAGKLFGHGFYNPHSQIALRMLSYDPAPVDENLFRTRLDEAVSWREQLFAGQSDTNAWRLVHAEGDRISGLIAERYADWIAIEVFSMGIFRRLEMFKRLFTERTGISHFVVRADERIQHIEGFRITPELSDSGLRTVKIVENGVRFKVNVQSGHKTGFFCDQRENRLRLAGLCGGREVLDVCCYTGGFGIYASKLGEAASVTGVDLDENAIELARQNANLNERRIQYVHADAFAYLRQMQTNRRTFDVVVLDPPKFVANKDELEEGGFKYADLNALAMSVVKPGGLMLTCSCSGLVSAADFQQIVIGASRRTRRSLQIVDTTGPGADHPVMANCPESGYLKAVWARVW